MPDPDYAAPSMRHHQAALDFLENARQQIIEALGNKAGVNHDHDQDYAPRNALKAGVVNVDVNASVSVSFNTPFPNVPKVVLTSQFLNADPSSTYSAHTITVNGFTIQGAGNPAGDVAWFATIAGNP